MIARLARTAVAFVAFAVVALAGLFFWSKVQTWRFEQAVAEAEAWNRTHWETGSALRITARLNYRSFDETVERETSLICFQKRMVGRGNGRRPTIYTVSEGLGVKALFATHGQSRSIYVGPSGGFCTKLFRDGPPADLPAHFAGDVVINELPDEGATELDSLTQRLGPTCRLRWTTGQPLDLERGIVIDEVEITSIVEVPVSSALSKPELMGGVDERVIRLFATFSGADPDKPARFQWSETETCWLRTNSGECVTEADDICGVPRF